MTQFETARLLMRPIQPTDQAALQAIILDRQVVAYLRYRTIKTPAQFKTIFDTHFLADTNTVFGIERKSDHQLIGFYEFHSEDTTGLLTYALSPVAWGHGYVAEAGQALMAYGFETLNYQQIEARYASVNPRSGRVMAKMGMHDLGELHAKTLDSGEVVHVMRYVLSKKDWLVAKSA